jgi:hypothetical protein
MRRVERSKRINVGGFLTRVGRLTYYTKYLEVQTSLASMQTLMLRLAAEAGGPDSWRIVGVGNSFRWRHNLALNGPGRLLSSLYRMPLRT